MKREKIYLAERVINQYVFLQETFARHHRMEMRWSREYCNMQRTIKKLNEQLKKSKEK